MEPEQPPTLTTKIWVVITVWPSNVFADWIMLLKLAADTEYLGTIGPDSVAPNADQVGDSHVANFCLIWRAVTSKR